MKKKLSRRKKYEDMKFYNMRLNGSLLEEIRSFASIEGLSINQVLNKAAKTYLIENKK